MCVTQVFEYFQENDALNSWINNWWYRAWTWISHLNAVSLLAFIMALDGNCRKNLNRKYSISLCQIIIWRFFFPQALSIIYRFSLTIKNKRSTNVAWTYQRSYAIKTDAFEIMIIFWIGNVTTSIDCTDIHVQDRDLMLHALIDLSYLIRCWFVWFKSKTHAKHMQNGLKSQFNRLFIN